jgi:hypothetical protein
MPLIVLVLYVAACAVCGVMGRNTTIGFTGHFFMALLLTPVIDFVVQVVGRPNARMRDKLQALK